MMIIMLDQSTCPSYACSNNGGVISESIITRYASTLNIGCSVVDFKCCWLEGTWSMPLLMTVYYMARIGLRSYSLQTDTECPNVPRFSSHQVLMYSEFSHRCLWVKPVQKNIKIHVADFLRRVLPIAWSFLELYWHLKISHNLLIIINLVIRPASKRFENLYYKLRPIISREGRK